jgi:hypothetical protein
MHVDPVLVTDLHEQAALLDVDDHNLPAVVRLLQTAAELAVASLLGWRVVFIFQGQTLTLNSLQHPRVDTTDVRASLRVRLTTGSTPLSDGVVTLYAAEPGAFTALAADVARALHRSADQLPLDQDLAPELVHGLTPTWTSAPHPTDASITDLTAYRTVKSLMSNF